jgi:hypothetical protein
VSDKKDERQTRAFLIPTDQSKIEYFSRYNDALVMTGDENVFIKYCYDGDLPLGGIVILKPTDEKVPNSDLNLKYWERVV